MSIDENNEKTEGYKNFIEEIIEEHLDSGRYNTVITRLPPEPNGYMHVGHAWAFLLNYEMSQKYGGHCNLRFDDTNPKAEETEFVESIEDDIRWLGIDFGEKALFASDYFDQLYEYAVQLVKDGKAYVDSLNPEEMKEYRGPWNEPGKNSPDRERPIEENLDLLERMKEGEFEEGAYTLRAKIDMTSSNMNMRDPAMYRILNAVHHRTGDAWHIYPTYDWAHGQSDSIEGITHSLCSIEFENHRPLYDWFIENLGIHAPQQIEFARLNLTYTVTSKRKLLRLVGENHVNGWDDPRMPTICGMRRRGYPAEAIRKFCRRTGVTRTYSVREFSLLEDSVREHLNKTADRRMAVLKPLKVVIENYPEGASEELDAINNPEDENAGTRKIPFSRELYIERDDFMEDPPKKFFRLAPGREVRFRYAYFVTCTDVIKDKKGEIVELRCTYDPETRGGDAPDGRKVKSTIHWVSADHAVDAEVRVYDHLFMKEDPNDVEEGQDFLSNLNPNSLEILEHCKLEPSLRDAEVGSSCQFERLGYFAVDRDSTPEKPVFNRTATLRDTWARMKGR